MSLLLLALVPALAVACSGSSGAGPTAAPSAITAPAATAAATPTAGAAENPGPPAPDGQLALAHVRKLAIEIGPRVAGTPGEIAARDYIKTTLESYGYDVEVEQFQFDASAFLPARVDAGGAAITAFALRGSSSGAATGRLFDVGIGRPEDFPAGGLNGGIALVRRGELTFGQKADNAVAAGASAVIVYNNEAGHTLGELSHPVAVPVVGIDQSDGQDLASRAPALGSVTVTVSPPQGTAYNVIARPKGVSRCTTVTGGHYDSVPVTGGADDNASGSASVLETARVVAAQHLAGANCFVLFSAEEFGLFGSKQYVQQLSPDDLQAVRAMINMDVVGLKEGLTLIGSADMVDTARLAAQRLGLSATPATLPQGVGSDHLSFEDAGVPVVMLYRDDNQIHTPADAIGRIDPDSLKQTVAVAVATLQTLNGG